ncbi:galactose oxidase [Ascobolus immersus RN42]|uniref:Galactose oxidase n=1 Tax=Ascobolus immersus RN42 TaxID=1160509 RepID=A0A3N4I4A2_ASCIM|nr:galactose oxidase [Ascobolus immersus RN42]
MFSYSVLFAVSLLATEGLANISFPKPVIECDKPLAELNGASGKCLKGQWCGPDKLCHFSEISNIVKPQQLFDNNLAKRAPTTDGRCGKDFGGATCAGWPAGECCSQYGYCGNTEGHCGAGCQSGCAVQVTTTVTPTPSNTPAPGGPPASKDGRCGKGFGNATCKGWPLGECCSEYGYCGGSAAHCGVGCQNGCDGGDPTSSAPIGEPTASIPITKDGTCGRTNGGAICMGWPQGECCSMYGFCGDTSAHCGDGCQNGPCSHEGGGDGPAPQPAPITNGGRWDIVGDSGVPVMHAALMPNGRVIFLDKVEDYTKLKLPNGRLAYSAEYDPVTNTKVALSYKTNAFCAGGTFLADGRLLAIGGNGPLDWLDPTVTDGFDGLRYIRRSASDASLNGQSWSEPGHKLASKRWYPSAQTLADGRVFVTSGSLNGLDPGVPANNNPTYEILSKDGVSNGRDVPMAILVDNQPYYMYPFMHLLKDGKIYVFTAKASQIFDIAQNRITKTLPDMPGMYRTYPNTGGSVLLPLSAANNWNSKVIICGGGAYQDITSPCDPSCGTIAPEAANAAWEMEAMPEGRGGVEGTLLPDGTILWLNGHSLGAQGFLLAANPTLRALHYDPTKPVGQRFTQLAASTRPRLYHSVALLMLDGTVMVTGSNPNEMPILTPTKAAPYVTDFTVEKFTPPYLLDGKAARRPTNLVIPNKTWTSNGSVYTITFNVPTTTKAIKISLYHGGFVTHSVHMGHRMMFLSNTGFVAGRTSQTVRVTMPPNRNIAPPGPYVVYVVGDGIPSVGQFVTVN